MYARRCSRWRATVAPRWKDKVTDRRSGPRCGKWRVITQPIRPRYTGSSPPHRVVVWAISGAVLRPDSTSLLSRDTAPIRLPPAMTIGIAAVRGRLRIPVLRHRLLEEGWVLGAVHPGIARHKRRQNPAPVGTRRAASGRGRRCRRIFATGTAGATSSVPLLRAARFPWARCSAMCAVPMSTLFPTSAFRDPHTTLREHLPQHASGGVPDVGPVARPGASTCKRRWKLFVACSGLV